MINIAKNIPWRVCHSTQQCPFLEMSITFNIFINYAKLKHHAMEFISLPFIGWLFWLLCFLALFGWRVFVLFFLLFHDFMRIHTNIIFIFIFLWFVISFYIVCAHSVGAEHFKSRQSALVFLWSHFWKDLFNCGRRKQLLFPTCCSSTFVPPTPNSPSQTKYICMSVSIILAVTVFSVLCQHCTLS